MPAYGLGSLLPIHKIPTTVYTLTDGVSSGDGMYKCKFASGGVTGTRLTPWGDLCHYMYPARAIGWPTTGFDPANIGPPDTHAPLLIALTPDMADFQFSCLCRTKAHKRQNYSPMSWERGPWFIFRYNEATVFHYDLGIKSNGTELSRIGFDDGVISGHAQLQQTVIDTQTTYKYRSGNWIFVEIKMVGQRIQVWIDGQAIHDFTDTIGAAPLAHPSNAGPGKLVFYTEDSESEYYGLRYQAL